MGKKNYWMVIILLMLLIVALPVAGMSAEVRIGGSLPLSGAYGKVAKMYDDGYRFWLETHDYTLYAGGRPYKIIWKLYDDEHMAETTAKLTEKLITQDKVNLIAGSYGTAEIMAQGAIAKKHGMITVQGGAASFRVNEEYPGTIFQLVPVGDTYCRSIMAFASTLKPLPKNVAILSMDDPVYREIGAGAKKYGAKYGLVTVFEEILPMDIKDLRPVVLKMKAKGNIDFVVNTGWDAICIGLVRSASQINFNAKMWDGGHLTTNPVVKKTLGRKLEYVFGRTWWLPEMKYPGYNWKRGGPKFKNSLEFAKAFKAKFGYDADYHTMLAWSVLDTYAIALQDVTADNPFDPSVVKEAVAKVNYVNLFGPCRFSPEGRSVAKDMGVIQWQGKDPQLKIVWPLNIRNAEPKYPTPSWDKR